MVLYYLLEINFGRYVVFSLLFVCVLSVLIWFWVISGFNWRDRYVFVIILLIVCVIVSGKFMLLNFGLVEFDI